MYFQTLTTFVLKNNMLYIILYTYYCFIKKCYIQNSHFNTKTVKSMYKKILKLFT